MSINEDQKYQTLELYKKIKALFMLEKDKLSEMEYGVQVVIGALGSGILSFLYDNTDSDQQMIDILDSFCEELKKTALENKSRMKVT